MKALTWLAWMAAASAVLPVWAQPQPQNISYSLVDANGNGAVIAPGGTITFPQTPVGSISTVSVSFSYQLPPGTPPPQVPLTLNSISIEGDGFQLSGVPIPGIIIEPGRSITVAVRFNPRQLGTASGRLTISLSTGNARFNLVGVAQGATLSNFVFSMIDTNGNASLLEAGGVVAFPATAAGTASAVTVALTNQSAVASTVNAISSSGDPFTLSGVPIPGTAVEPGRAVSFTVRFAPSQPGDAQGSLQIGLAAGTVRFTLRGTAQGPALVYRVQQGSTVSTPVASDTITVNQTPTGQQTVLTVQVRNTGNSPAQISTIAVQGAGFQLENVPFLPATLNAGEAFSFGLIFAPTQPGQVLGRLKIGNDTFDLIGRASGSALAFTYSSSGSLANVLANGNVLFSPAPVGGTSSTRFTITNQGTTPAALTTIGVGGTAASSFSLTELPALPTTLGAGAALTFTILFSPAALGVTSGTLVIDGQSFTLTGSGTTPPPLPPVTLSGPGAVVDPLAQPAVSLSLNNSYPLAVTGTLSLTFVSDAFVDDPAIQFSTGGRTVNFSIPANTTRAVFSNGANQIRFSTGSVAGAIALASSFATAGGVSLTPENPPALRMAVAQAPPKLLNVQVDSKSASGLTVTLTGLATARNMTQLNFQFQLAQGVSVQAPAVTMNVESAFNVWYQGTPSQASGSLFTASVPFTLQGKVDGYANLADAIQAVTVTATNKQGAAAPATVQLR